MFERILVPLDGSELAEQALPLATRLAQAGDGNLLLMRSVIVGMLITPIGFDQDMSYRDWEHSHRRREATAYLKAIQASGRLKDVSTRFMTLDGEPASTIVDLAADDNYDLIVMTTNGERGVTRWVFGSVTERVLRNATCPVLVLREDRPIKRILVPLDGSKLAEASIAPALEVAKRLGAAITLLRVDDSLSRLDDASIASLDQMEPGLSDLMRVSYARRGEEYLTTVRNRLDTTVRVNILSRVGKPVDTILDTIDAEACDLIVMSTHGRSGLQRWVYGSVTEKVLHSAEIPMLIVRPAFK